MDTLPGPKDTPAVRHTLPYVTPQTPPRDPCGISESFLMPRRGRPAELLLAAAK